MQNPIFTELYRNNILESVHRGHAVVMHANGDILFEAGDKTRIIFPRSSCKMLQALPLVDSGAASHFGLSSAQLALSCASHNGEKMHTEGVHKWLKSLDLDEGDLRCGPQAPAHFDDQAALHEAGEKPCRIHNNCSGKHSGFLTYNKHIGGHADYHQMDHPLQIAIKNAFEEMTDEVSTGYGIDGCSAPNFTTSVQGLARGVANMSLGEDLGGARGKSAKSLIEAMMVHPELVSGTKRACADLMHAGKGKVAVKTGAEGVFVAILPERQIGVALKIEDGTTRAAENAIAAILVRLGVVDAADPLVTRYLNAPLRNFNKEVVGNMQASDAIWQNGAAI